MYAKGRIEVEMNMCIQILQIAAREFFVRNNLNLAITLLCYGDYLAEIASTTFALDTIMQEFFEV